MKTKLSVSVAAAALAALMLAGCSSAEDPTTSASPTAGATQAPDTAALMSAANAALETVSWDEDDKGVPTLKFDQPFSVGTNAVRVIKDGDGAEIHEGDIVSLTYTVTSGQDGTVAYSTYDSGTSEAVTLAQKQIDPVLIDALVGAHVGVTFLYAAVDPSSTPATSVIMAVKVANAVTPLERATGTAVTPAEGLPVVTLDSSGAPSIKTPSTKAPTDLVAQTLIKGEGATVKEGQTVTVNYTGWVWGNDGTPFDSSWQRGSTFSTPLDKSSLIEGWVTGLAGQTVGSQVLLVIPSSLGYGDKDSADGAIPGGSTLVFVVDILAAQ